MKRILGIVAVTGLLAAAPAFAGVDVFVNFGLPAPVVVAPAPVYLAPAAYRHFDPRWHERHERFERREYREHHGFRDHREFRNRY
jgi:hypothetical protein